MKTLTDQLSSYAGYHRDRRNIATHFVGIPMIVFAAATLLARPAVLVAGLAISPIWLVGAGVVVYYVALDARFGGGMAALVAAAVWGATRLAAMPTAAWLGIGVGMFVVGWIFQLVGHAFEGRKPAFVDDLAGLLIGPLFVVAEVAFALGLRGDVNDEIVRRAGPIRTVVRRSRA